MWKEWELKHWQGGGGEGGEEDRECDERTPLREIWREWEENGEQEQKIEGVGDC